VRVVDIVHLPIDMFPFTRMFWVANAQVPVHGRALTMPGTVSEACLASCLQAGGVGHSRVLAGLGSDWR
jgi:hypothetical protein